MVSTFNGLEVAKRGLFTQQSALYTTGHNISNANTDGYTRQRVNFEQTSPFPPGSRNRPEIPGQMGSGVQAGSIERVRDQFLDIQYRNETKNVGYYDAQRSALYKMEEIMNEPTDQGLAKTMDRFWQSLQDMSVNPEDEGARSVVRQRGLAVAETFNYLSNSLQTVQKDLKNQVNVASRQFNSTLNQINSLNQQISEVEPHGYLPNDLYDERDRLIDDLSEMASIDVSYSPSGDSSEDIALGVATIRLADEIGQPVNPPMTLVDGATDTVNEISVSYADTANQTVVKDVTIGEQTMTVDQFSSVGKLKGLMEVGGYMNSTPSEPAYVVGQGFKEDEDGNAFLPSSMTGQTISVTGSTEEEGEFTTGETVDVEITDGMTLQDLATQLNNPDEGIEATIQNQDGVQRLVVKSTAQGSGATMKVEGSAAQSLQLDGEFTGMNEVSGNFSDMLGDLDVMASAFAMQFNEVHSSGGNLTSDATDSPHFFSYGQSLESTHAEGEGTGHPYYKGIASNLGITDAVESNLDHIAASNISTDAAGNDAVFAGNGGNAEDLANIQEQPYDLLGNETNINSFYEGMIGGMAVDAQENRRMVDNSATLQASVQNQRDSVSAVSLDEEMTNMVKFQHAYNAAARNITVVDEMIDRIINQMGRVGR
ncbi:flagellar hook-associated protein FlgK [Halobacillus locisalis]|uniref:Flagellar hook-associated protein 1 n=1 Tax=Halobacillus locisalis TaxID=220753 RepID=A0A838CUG3_9BACI|nr:flagellar hook-associated protein FlgK [Halobacillus locisalis]MBA2175561.1 flagellar hook-associated protein FlgK [Halobacillus locisalis]